MEDRAGDAFAPRVVEASTFAFSPMERREGCDSSEVLTEGVNTKDGICRLERVGRSADPRAGVVSGPELPAAVGKVQGGFGPGGQVVSTPASEDAQLDVGELRAGVGAGSELPAAFGKVRGGFGSGHSAGAQAGVGSGFEPPAAFGKVQGGFGLGEPVVSTLASEDAELVVGGLPAGVGSGGELPAAFGMVLGGFGLGESGVGIAAGALFVLTSDGAQLGVGVAGRAQAEDAGRPVSSASRLAAAAI